MSSEEALTSLKWGLWVQPDGANTESHYLGCHDMDDTTIPGSTTGLFRCYRADGSGWNIIGSTRTPPDPITIKITTPLMSEADWLEKLVCPANFYVMGVQCGRRDLFPNWDRGFGFNHAEESEAGLIGLTKREEDVLSEQSFSYSVRPPVLRFYGLNVQQQSTTETESLNDISFCNQEKCADACGTAEALGESGLIVSDSLAGSPTNTADVLSTTTSGGTWTATVADPFAGGEDIISSTCFYVDKNTIRWLVAREADAGAPMEVAYSDDSGGTWNLVTVGSVNAQGANHEGALFSLNMYNIWLAVDGGYVYKSEDGGVTWAVEDAGIATTEDLNEVWAADYKHIMIVGDNDAVLFSDGSGAWSAATATGGGNNLLCCTWSGDFWWAGDDAGGLYFSSDDGATWTQRTLFPGSGTGTIADIEFGHNLAGFMLHNTVAPLGTVLFTWDGGYTWTALQTPTNSGLNSITVLSPTLAYAVGEAHGGIGFILRISI